MLISHTRAIKELTKILRPELGKNIHSLVLYGSVARNEADIDSDIDIMIDFEETKSLMKIGGIQYDLEEMLGRPVDLVSRKNIKPSIKKNILNDVKVLYEKR